MRTVFYLFPFIILINITYSFDNEEVLIDNNKKSFSYLNQFENTKAEEAFKILANLQRGTNPLQGQLDLNLEDTINDIFSQGLVKSAAIANHLSGTLKTVFDYQTRLTLYRSFLKFSVQDLTDILPYLEPIQNFFIPCGGFLLNWIEDIQNLYSKCPNKKNALKQFVKLKIRQRNPENILNIIKSVKKDVL